jgi:hypothetical protein
MSACFLCGNREPVRAILPLPAASCHFLEKSARVGCSWLPLEGIAEASGFGIVNDVNVNETLRFLEVW